MSLHHNARQGALQMIATRDIQPGQEIINSYGDLSNGELLRRFGFIELEANPFNCVDLSLQVLLEAAASDHPDQATHVRKYSQCSDRQTHSDDGGVLPGSNSPSSAGGGKKTCFLLNARGGLEPLSATTGPPDPTPFGSEDVERNRPQKRPIVCLGDMVEEKVQFLEQFGVFGGTMGHERGCRGLCGESSRRGPAARHAVRGKAVHSCTKNRRHGRFSAFRISAGGVRPQVVEAARVLALKRGDFLRFQREVLTWRIPKAKPLSSSISPRHRSNSGRQTSTAHTTTGRPPQGRPHRAAGVRDGFLVDPEASSRALPDAGPPMEPVTQRCQVPGTADASPGDDAPVAGGSGGAREASVSGDRRGGESGVCAVSLEESGLPREPADGGTAGCRALLSAAVEHMLARYPGYREQEDARLPMAMFQACGVSGGDLMDERSCVHAHHDSLQVTATRAGPRPRSRRAAQASCERSIRESCWLNEEPAEGEKSGICSQETAQGKVSARVAKDLKGSSEADGDSIKESNPPPGKSEESARSANQETAAAVVGEEIEIWKALARWVRGQTDEQLLALSRSFWLHAL